MTIGVIAIEKAEHDRFFSLWNSKHPDFNGQRLGQAFYNHFNLHKMSSSKALNDLYEADGDKAKALIVQYFNLT